MTVCKRLLLILALLSAGLIAATEARKWRGRAPLPEAPDEEAREAELDRGLRAARQRIDAKWKVVRRLLAGELTLLEAAARFRDLNAEPADCPAQDSHLWPSASPEERLCRQVIAWARAHSRDDSSGAAGAVVDRLEAELAALLARGAIRRRHRDSPRPAGRRPGLRNLDHLPPSRNYTR
jgi:hypothetical protein